MKYILLGLIALQSSGNSLSVVQQEFDSEAACLAARESIAKSKQTIEKYKGFPVTYNIQCVPKGSSAQPAAPQRQ